MSPSKPLFLREAVNVEDLKERDKLVRRLRAIRSAAIQGKADLEHWNRLHPNDTPISVAYEDAVIAWCDGKISLDQVGVVRREHGIQP